MIAAVEHHTTIQHHHLTSHQLLKQLANNGVRATGTIREFSTSKFELPSNHNPNKNHLQIRD